MADNNAAKREVGRNPHDARFNNVTYLQFGIHRVCTKCNTAVLLGMDDYHKADEEGKFRCYLCDQDSENNLIW